METSQMESVLGQIDKHVVSNGGQSEYVADIVSFHQGFKDRHGKSVDEVVGYVNQTDTPVEKALQLSHLSKALSTGTRGLAEALSTYVSDSIWAIGGFFSLINPSIRTYKQLKQNAQYSCSLLCLREICTYLSGQTGTMEQLKIIKAVIKPDAWDVQHVNDMYDKITKICEMTEALIAAISGESESEEYIECLYDINAIYQSLESLKGDFPELANFADAENLLILTARERAEVDSPLLALDKKKALAAMEKFNTLDIIHREIIKGHKTFKGIATGIVIKPGDENNRDLHGDYMSAEAIEEACIYYMVNSQVMGINHVEFSEKQGIDHPDFICWENWITKCDQTIGGDFVPRGTWMRSIIAVSERGRDMLMERTIQGFSPGGMAYIQQSPIEEVTGEPASENN